MNIGKVYFMKGGFVELCYFIKYMNQMSFHEKW